MLAGLAALGCGCRGADEGMRPSPPPAASLGSESGSGTSGGAPSGATSAGAAQASAATSGQVPLANTTTDPTAGPSGTSAESGACPDDMALVDVEFCADVHRKCLHAETGGPNHLTICHEFAPGTTCTSAPRRQRFCIDRYEYPNRRGAHPPVHVNAYDAAALCSAAGKRLCWESEWTAACEGPEHLPFPYGLARSSAACNIDNAWIAPDLDAAYSHDARTADAELRRIDQSVPSGSRPACRSGFDVYDQPGNFDEWVRTEERRGLGDWAALKGGAWGHVRNACRPATTSHVPQFRYYFISFRCCRDPDAGAAQPAVSPVGPPGAAGPVGAAPWRPPAFPIPNHPAPRESGWWPR